MDAMDISNAEPSNGSPHRARIVPPTAYADYWVGKAEVGTSRDYEPITTCRPSVSRSETTPEDRAFDLISAVIESGDSPVEASNAFDEWKDALEGMAESAASKSIEYRQVLGMVIECVSDRDVTDFDSAGLSKLHEASGLLRRPRLVTLDAERAYALISALATNLTLSLEVTDAEQQAALDKLADELMKRASKP